MNDKEKSNALAREASMYKQASLHEEAKDELWPEDKKFTSCIRCHRALKNPKSMAAGEGPVCAKKSKRAREA